MAELPLLMVLESAHISYWLSEALLSTALPATWPRRSTHAALAQLHCAWSDRVYVDWTARIGVWHAARRRQTPGVPLPTNSKPPA
jgi:hypothetical protein